MLVGANFLQSQDFTFLHRRQSAAFAVVVGFLFVLSRERGNLIHSQITIELHHRAVARNM